MGQQIPIPASTLEALAENARKIAREEGRAGNTNNEETILTAHEKAYEAVHGVEGSTLTSIEKRHLSTLAGFGDYAPQSARDTARTFLEQYDVW